MKQENKRFLIIKPSSLGDIVHTLPVVHALKRCFPTCFIGWIVQAAYADLLRQDGAIDAVYSVSIASTSDPQAARFAYMRAFRQTMASLRQLRRTFVQEPYDLIFDLHASFRSGLLGRANPGGVRIGFEDARELNTFFQNRLVKVPDHVEHALEKNLLFSRFLGCAVLPEDFYMSSSAADKAAVRSFLDGYTITDSTVIIYANPAARWQTKFWPAAYWAELADRFARQNRILVFGGSRQDKEYIDTIVSRMTTPAVIAAGHFSLTETAALLKRSSLYVGLDSGPMHMAALCGTPVVALFGPTHPARVGPYGVDCRIVRAEGLDCLECRKRVCSHLRCMHGISVDMVHEAAMSLLS